MTSQLFTVLLLLLLTPTLCSAACASIAVRGHLMCNGQPYAREQVQVWEPKTLGAELWGDVETDGDGNFLIYSHGYDITLIDAQALGFGFHPYVWIPNYCGSEWKDGQRCTKNLINILIPEGYIQPCQPDVQVFDMGTIHMESERPTEFNWWQRILGQHYQCKKH